MSTAKITLFTFARWKQMQDDDLFINLAVPPGIDRQTLIDNILLRGGEFEVVYSDPDFMQYSIGTWCRKWYRTMQKWIDALNIDYNPLENYDRYEHWQDVTDRDTVTEGSANSNNLRTLGNTDTRTLSHADETTFNNQDKTIIDSEIHDTIDEDDTRENFVSAFDSSDYQPSSKETLAHDGDNTKEEDTTNTTDHTGTIRDDHVGTITDDHTGTINDDYADGHHENGSEDTDSVHDGHVHGNIGVTTSQQMLQQELDIAQWNIYEHITDLFLNEFVIPIYS